MMIIMMIMTVDNGGGDVDADDESRSVLWY